MESPAIDDDAMDESRRQVDPIDGYVTVVTQAIPSAFSSTTTIPLP